MRVNSSLVSVESCGYAVAYTIVATIPPCRFLRAAEDITCGRSARSPRLRPGSTGRSSSHRSVTRRRALSTHGLRQLPRSHVGIAFSRHSRVVCASISRKPTCNRLSQTVRSTNPRTRAQYSAQCCAECPLRWRRSSAPRPQRHGRGAAQTSGPCRA